MQVQRGKLYRMTGHKGLSDAWVRENGAVWLAERDEWLQEDPKGKYSGNNWLAEFRSVATGKLFQVSRYQPWSVELEELNGGDT